MPYSKEEIKHLAFVRRLREKNAVQYITDRDVYLTEWINNPASRGGQDDYAGQSNYGWRSNNGKLIPGQVLNMAPKTEVNGKMVYNLYQDIQTGNIQQGITFISRQVAYPGSTMATGYDVELTVNFVETISQGRDRFVPHSAVKVIDNRFKEVDYLTSGTSDYTSIADNTSDTTSGNTGSTSNTSTTNYTGGGGGSGTSDTEIPTLDT
ncbi:hypothetical protein HN615_00955 [Candidatus Woesearchaeota archaeon]|jgi:hypothetical protein|nr:hypothetical protein [Candidatus Woesearchaeota archaeon]